MSYEKKLLAMKGLVKKQPERLAETNSPPPVIKKYKEWKAAGYELMETDAGDYYKISTFFPNSYLHGKVQFYQLSKLVQKVKEMFPGHPLTPHPESKLFFYDTETTGLKGAGVHIFLNGVLFQTEAGFQLDQYLLASPEYEVAFLQALPFAEQDTLITYNGKSFDIPQLEVRWTMNRKKLKPFPGVLQIDLLHGSKRLWKGQQQRFKLQDMEKEHLGFHREDDMPGHLAPIVYMDALRSGNTENLDRILEHNKWDLLSLVSLYIHSLRHLLDESSESTSKTELNLAKWLKDLKLLPHSRALYEKVTERYEQQDIPHAYYYLSLLQKREGAFAESLELMQVAAKELQGVEKLEALIHCAKLLEHQLKEYENAKFVVIQAKTQLLTLTATLPKEKLALYLQDLKNRDARIARKIISRESAAFDK
ncbi:ribonuclease H-like domain-containing protein [Chryseomicrobium sp. FSL W7-1435]|uniref:ribonuclease H-like domain-containing protein n=1 Tax=Chryseomicrobium sp. FSL W7-1435 TaxID=2921704 RepID=UPI00315A861E